MSLHTMRQEALLLFNQGVRCADPYKIVKNKLISSNQQLEIGQLKGNWNRIHLLAIGKAACKMLSAAMEQIPPAKIVFPVIAVTNTENAFSIAGCEVYISGHPIPDQHGIEASQAVLKQLNQCQPGDLLLVLLSGGGSALLPLPAATLTLSDKITLNQMLLNCGADINEINCVRKHCSSLKGGGMARMAKGADIACLAISDVINDDPGSIASGPTQVDATCYADAIKILEKYSLWNNLPDSIKQHLNAGTLGVLPETLKSDHELSGLNHFEIIASNKLSVLGISEAIRAMDYPSTLVINGLHGEAKDVAHSLVNQVDTALNRSDLSSLALLAGGETTVTISHICGKGGRNQEMALAFALNAEKIGLRGQWCFLSAGTDGRDGPTDAAGAIVDNLSLNRMRAAGIRPEQALEAHDSYAALQSSQDLLMTGATGTNVADLQILLWKPIYTSGEQYV